VYPKKEGEECADDELSDAGEGAVDKVALAAFAPDDGRLHEVLFGGAAAHAHNEVER